MGVPINNVSRRVVYAASGTGPYAFTFEILAAADIAVYKDDTLLTLTTDYTVTINANGTGSITLTASPTGATQIAIVGNRTIQRLTDFVTGGDLFANTINDELDQQTIFAQQNAEGLDRSLKAPQTDPTSINMTLPRASVRANKTLAFDANGNPTTGEVIGDNRGNWAAGTAYNKRDIVKDTSNGNIYYANTAHTSSGSQPISSNADSAKWDLIVDNAAAGASASAAAASASAAASSASAASTSASNASSSASSAASSASAASTSASNASTSATNAASSASTASTQASNAATSATNAANSATSASNSASTATTQATNASNSASSASTSATNAANSASSASSSASSASSSASSASTSASNAASSATAAAASATSAAASYDSFDDRYLGAKTSDPTLDNDGNALLTGALYFNSSTGEMKVYSGSAWVSSFLTAGAQTIAGVKTFASNPILSAGTANGVAYLNGSKVLTTGSALTFDGNKLAIQAASATANRIDLFNDTGNATFRVGYDASNNLTITRNAGDANIYLNATQSGAAQVWQLAGTEGMRLTSTGLGIGTSSPSNRLSVNSGASTTVATFTSTGSAAFLGLANSGATTFIGNDSTSGNFVIQTPASGFSTKLTLDNTGNLGLGVTPSTWYTGFKSFQAGATTALADFSSGTYLFNNWYIAASGANTYLTSNFASSYSQVSGEHRFYTAPSGTAGNTISFTQAMTLDASSQLLVGTTSNPYGNRFTVGGSATYRGIEISTTTASARPTLTFLNINTNTYGSFIQDSSAGDLIFGRVNADYGGHLERARITSGGDLLVGTTSDTPAQSNVSGFKVGGGQIECNGTNTQAAFFGRSNDGQVIRFFNAGSAAGNISNTGTTTSYNGTSDYRLKENIQPMVGALEKVAQLKPCTYTWKADGRLGQGFIAHELQEVIPDAVQGTKDEVDENGNPEYQGIDPRMIVATLTAAIQELKAQNDDLRARVAQLETLKGN